MSTGPVDPSFEARPEPLLEAVRLLLETPGGGGAAEALGRLPEAWPRQGLGDAAALGLMAEVALAAAQRLDDPLSFAHMDPPTPWLTWATTLWNARLNQNLLHPATAPVARDIERLLLSWIGPAFGMDGGHMTPGSTVANITAIWAARELAGVTAVVAAETAHLSIEKSARLLGLGFRRVPTDRTGRLDHRAVGDVDQVCLVLVAGSTSTGAIDPLSLVGSAAWTHVDAAWAGPLRFSERYRDRLGGIEKADSVAVSGHKWLFQPKESGLVLFRDSARAHEALTFGGSYLAVPNIGLLGSHGAVAVPLLATLLAWGQEGLAERLDRCMEMAERFAGWIRSEPRLELFAAPETGVIVWRPAEEGAEDLAKRLPAGLASLTRIEGAPWLRCVAANPNADVDAIIAAVAAALELRL